ncbi:DsbA family oxidoreductase [Acuticoccus yangtzensis]|uniref:DsbA family oxidoreductase n=1 Tax=Acuticoccus yangtzensis TaxID=1443441 RepID=UPI0009F93DD6|nr:DsbA family oxidoreductase [Acuticoccus yangtzensis]
MTQTDTPAAGTPKIDTTALEPVHIDIVSDVMCPWCYIGKRRLEKALATLDDVTVRVSWRPFQLDPTLPADGKDRAQYLNEKFGGPDRAAEIYARITAAGAEEEIPFAFDKITRSPNTLNAHRVIRWAGIEGLQDAVVERLFQLYFIEGADLTDPAVLEGAAAEAGMDPAMVARLLATDADLAETEAEIVHAQAIGVQGVPCFIIENKYAVSGAQPADVLATAIRQVAVAKAGGDPVAAG